MIKVGIAGADTDIAGEILRILIHHPDVEMQTAYAPELAGRPVASGHYGFIGEQRILFTSNFDATALDLAILMRGMYSESDWAKLMSDNPNLKLILFPEARGAATALDRDPVYGLSEMNRKPLVRGARVALMPTPAASLALAALYPVAAHLMLPSEIKIDIEAPSDIIKTLEDGTVGNEIASNLQRVQSSFGGNLQIVAREGSNPRGMRVRIEIPTAMGIDEMMKVYDSIYDDHNFTYMVTFPVDMEETEGTQRIIISILKTESGGIAIEAVADPRMRGGAGDAVHLMNLLFNLHEKTGLDLKTTGWIVK